MVDSFELELGSKAIVKIDHFAYGKMTLRNILKDNMRVSVRILECSGAI